MRRIKQSKFQATSSGPQKAVSARRLLENSIASATFRLSAGVVPKASGCRVLLKVPLADSVFKSGVFNAAIARRRAGWPQSSASSADC